MSLYCIGDLHLSLSSGKPMDIFSGWENYVKKIEKNLSTLKDEDTLIILGDFSWAMNLKDAVKDFEFLNKFKGKKYFIKGNHDFWWTTKSKINKFFTENNFADMEIIQNNAVVCEDKIICGTRGWYLDEQKGTENDVKVLNREVIRLEMALDEAYKLKKENPEKEILLMLHYPPVYGDYKCDIVLEVLKKYHVKKVFFGHIHGKNSKGGYKKYFDGINYYMVSADMIDFMPLKI